jgi:hypothetical protein
MKEREKKYKGEKGKWKKSGLSKLVIEHNGRER